MLETIVVGVIVLLGVLLGALYIVKRIEKIADNLAENVLEDVENWLQSENTQKQLYAIGVLVGNGAKSGFGLTARGGKFKLTDVIGQGLAGWFFSKIPGAQTAQEQPTPQQQVPQA